MKRLFDFTATALGLLALALPLLVLAWLVRRKLGSPVFFTQVRPAKCLSDAYHEQLLLSFKVRVLFAGV